MLFDDPDLPISMCRTALQQLREEVKTIAACASSIVDRSHAVEAQIDAALGSATPVANSTSKPHVIKLLLTRFDQEFQKRFHEPAPIIGAKDAATMKRLLTTRPAERIEELIVAFFDSDDEFIQRSGFTVGVFASQVGKLVVAEHTPTKVHGLTQNTAGNGRNAVAGAELIRQSFRVR